MTEKQASFKDTATNYVPKKTLNITDLDKVDLSWPLEDREAEDREGDTYSYKVMKVNGQEFRVPNPVLEKVKDMLSLRPDMKFIKVTKTGEGKATRYQVRLVE